MTNVLPKLFYPAQSLVRFPTPPVELCAWKGFGVVLASATPEVLLASGGAGLVKAPVAAGLCSCFCPLLMAVLPSYQSKASGVL